MYLFLLFAVQLYIIIHQKQSPPPSFLDLMTQSLTKPLNDSLKQSVEPPPSRSSHNSERQSISNYKQSIKEEILNEQQINTNENVNKCSKQKVILGIGVGMLILGLIMFLVLPPVIHSQIIKNAVSSAVLSPENQKLWAHFPGESKTVITRNFSFFNLQNEVQFMMKGHKPIFTQKQGYIITEMQDYLNTTYSEDMTKVSMRDWLHFQTHQDSRNMKQKHKIMNIPSLGYWFMIKNSRDSLIFIQGFSLLFKNIEQTIVDVVMGQGIYAQYLSDFKSVYTQLLQPSGISLPNSKFIYRDAVFGLGEKDNIQYWVRAYKSSFNQQDDGKFSAQAMQLKDYFTLTDEQMYYLLKQIQQYGESLQTLIFQNHYCLNTTYCTPRSLTLRQISSSFITLKTPPVSSITPTYTICTSNLTCEGYYPQLFAFYQQVYLKQHTGADPFLTFDDGMVRKWLNYDGQSEEGEKVEGWYDRNQSALLHIGNLDALFGNGTLHDKQKKDHLDVTQYLINIRQRFGLPGNEQTRVFWEWVKYINAHVLKQSTPNNQVLGIGNSFSSGMFTAFTYLQQNLQKYILTLLLKQQLKSATCSELISISFDTQNNQLINNICNYFGHNINSDTFIHLSVQACKNKYQKQWNIFIQIGISKVQMQSFCDLSVKGSFASMVHNKKVQINDLYDCSETPNPYCSDFQLALKQWANSTVTLMPILTSLNKAQTFAQWDKNAYPFQYSYFAQKIAQKQLPTFNISESFKLMSFDNYFSPVRSVRLFRLPQTPSSFKDYMRYIVIFISLKGLTNSRTASEYIFGYNDEYLLWRKQNYPPFGGDPSTPAYTAFNDLNTTAQEATLHLQWHTGKDNPDMTGQYSKINGKEYLTTNYSRFNGNQSYWVLEDCWGERDYFYGTSGKTFAPYQAESRNVSIYVPNLQRYGSGNLDEAVAIQRYGYDIDKVYLGRYIFQTGADRQQNQKYYQNYFAIFNETSVLGFPFLMTKHHFMNASSNWSQYIEVYNEDHSIKYQETSEWDDSYVIVEPYSGLSFQSTIFLQANYFYEPDLLFTNQQSCLLPVFAIYRSGNVTQELADQLFQPLTTAITVKTVLFYVGIVMALLGAALFGYGFFLFKRANKRRDEAEVKRSIKISMQPQSRKKEESSRSRSRKSRESSEQLEYKSKGADEGPVSDKDSLGL